MIQKRMNADTAVSPVVGVMLMLVVTIVIAAVVAVFASGVVTSTEVAPNAVVKVDGYEFTKYDTSFGPNSDLTKLCFKNIGGNDLDLTDMKVVFTFEGADNSLALGSYNEGKWKVGQILTITANPVYGILDASVKGESVVEYKFMTVGGQIVAKGSFVVNPENVVETYSLTATPTSITSGTTEMTVTFTVPLSYKDGSAKLTAVSRGYTLTNGTGESSTEVINGVATVTIDENGVATFSGITVSGDAGYCSLTATVDGSPTVSASCTVTVTA
ncbi:MAG TPA: type IV pilin [Methanocorpusculum sp.]|nr:type IV pilin [Methanocorpusculum sp.]